MMSGDTAGQPSLPNTHLAFACTVKDGDNTLVQPLFGLFIGSADDGVFNRGVMDGVITGKADEVSVFSAAIGDKLLVVGVGDRAALTPQGLRMAAGTACGWMRVHPKVTNDVGIYLYGDHPFDHCARLIMEGWELRNHSVQRSPKLAAKEIKLSAVPVFVGGQDDITREESDLGALTAHMAHWVRDIGNLRGSEGTPQVLANRAADFLGDLSGVTATVLDPAFYGGDGVRNHRRFGAFLSVANGAKNPPHGILAEHRCGKKGAKTFMIIGKMVTYDTGGFNRKPDIHMNEMYMDMMGMANATALFKFLVLTVGQYCDIILMCNGTENYDGTLPSDIVTTRGGELIEINHTDAEGRLTLGDGIDYGVETFHPKVILDLATLTGAAVAALGGRAALFSSRGEPSEFVGLEYLLPLVRAIEPSGFGFWPMPMPWNQGDLLASPECDGVNTDNSKVYGCGTAARYLQLRLAHANAQYGGNTVSIHGDIAGMMDVLKPKGWQVAGASPDPFIGLAWGLPGLIKSGRLFRR